MAQLITGTAPLSYQGVTAQTPPNFMRVNRIPTTQDYEFVIGTFWLYVATDPLANPAQALYQLARLSNTANTPTATWIQIYPASAAVPPLSIADGGTNAVAFGTIDGTVYYDGVRLVTTPTGTAGYVLTSNGAGMAPTYQAGGGGGIGTLDADAGSATGATVTIHGGIGIATTAAAATLTLNLDVPVDVTHGGTGQMNLMDHSVLVGAAGAGITQLIPGTNGQVLLGSTGADPVFATLTSNDGTIAFTEGAGTLNIDLTSPVPIASGGTNANGFANVEGTVCYNGTRLVSIAPGTADYVLTSNGPGNLPEFKVAGGGGGAGANAFSYKQTGNTGAVFGSNATPTYILGATNALAKIYDNGGTQFVGTTYTCPATGVWSLSISIIFSGSPNASSFPPSGKITITDATTPANSLTFYGNGTYLPGSVAYTVVPLDVRFTVNAQMTVGATVQFSVNCVATSNTNVFGTIGGYQTIYGYQIS